MPSLKIVDGNISNVGIGVEVIGDDISVETHRLNIENAGKAYSFRDSDVPSVINELLAKLPAKLSDDDVLRVLEQVRAAGNSQEAREQAVKRSAIWPAIRETVPDALALIIKTAVEYFKL